MPTNRTKRTRGRAGLDQWKLDQLLTGSHLLAGVGYQPTDARGGSNHFTEADWREVREQMEADWQLHGAAILAWWRGETDTFSAIYGSKPRGIGTPWAQTKFGVPTGG